ncbi:MAG TPA: hypothetical protein VK046_11385 [Actinomycetaceae bacterium]|nr:hypothetical protein [Actinomycetaceae bacterium]
MTSTTLRRGLAAVAVLAGLVVSGCGAHPGAAAVVNGERISENEVARAIEDFTTVTGQPVDAPMMLGTLIVAPIMVDVAAEHGVAASDAEAAALLDQQAELNNLEAPEDYSDGVLQVARMTLINQGLSQASDPQAVVDEINQRVDNADVEVSPRYGNFDPSGQIIAEPLPWIATPEQ